MKPARVHHYIPQFYLRAFADPNETRSGKPVIWVYEKGKRPRMSTPRAEANQRNFYGYENAAGEKQSIETLLSKTESAIAPTIRKADDLNYFFTESERHEMATFTVSMFIRGPFGREFLDNIASIDQKASLQERAQDKAQFKAEYDRLQRDTGFSVTADELREYILKGEWQVQQESAGYNLRWMAGFVIQMTPLLASYNYLILHARGHEVFLTSDNPVFTLVPDQNGEATLGMGFAQRGVEVFLPLSAQVCLRIRQSGPSGSASVDDCMVRQVNTAMMMCARRFVYGPVCSGDIAEKFDKIDCQIKYGLNAFVLPLVSKAT